MDVDKKVILLLSKEYRMDFWDCYNDDFNTYEWMLEQKIDNSLIIVEEMIKQHKNYIFVDGLIDHNNGLLCDCSDGYLKSIDGNRGVKLPHNNYTLLGIVDECINSSYAEDFSKELVNHCKGEGYCNYSEKEVNGWTYQLQTAVESMKTLIERLNLKQTDCILREEN